MAQTDRTVLAAAAESRNRILKEDAPSQVLYTPHDEEHEDRQSFRRRIDRDILPANKPEQAIQSLKTVLKLARNILRYPEELKYRKFKITNDIIQATIMVPKGVLQLVMDLGFCIKAEEHDSYCAYTSKTYHMLRIGASIIEEILDREVEKEKAKADQEQREEEEREAHKEKLHSNIRDDRKSVAARAQRERQSGLYEKGIPRRKGAPTKGNIVTIHG